MKSPIALTTCNGDASDTDGYIASDGGAILSARGFRMLASILSKAVSSQERCELCRVEIERVHRHLVNTDTREILCACRACSLLFYNKGAGSGYYRLIPERILNLNPDHRWRELFDLLEIPVGVVFFFFNSSLSRYVALYPGPAGATESILDTSAWEKFSRDDPDLLGIEDDIEAVIVRSDISSINAFIVPIDQCYSLVGNLRKQWRGFDGGAEAKAIINVFFNTLRTNSVSSEVSHGV